MKFSPVPILALLGSLGEKITIYPHLLLNDEEYRGNLFTYAYYPCWKLMLKLFSKNYAKEEILE